MFPYFLEHQVKQNLPGFKMLDYQLDYANHENYTSGESSFIQLLVIWINFSNYFNANTVVLKEWA